MLEKLETGRGSIFERRESEVRSYSRAIADLFVKASGSTMTSADGEAFIDFLAGCASLNYGHNDPDMKRALVDHVLGDGLAQGLDLATAPKRAFLETFEALILKPRKLDHRVQFTGPTGANAVEAAMKLARKATGRSTVVAFTNGYHGVSQGALAATGNRKHRDAAAAQLNHVFRAPFDGYHGAGVDTVAMLERMLDDPSSGLDAPAAFLFEVVQGEGGLNAASDDWVRGMAALARRHGALTIVDDIQAGCGRTGTFFSFESAGIVPDLVTLSKSISGFGLPMALLMIRPEWDVWHPAEHNGTFRGNNHAFVTARVALEKFWSDGRFAAETARKGRIVGDALAAVAAKIPGARVKGRGMMQGVDVGSGELASAICRRCYRDGLIVETSGSRGEVVKILAPLTTPDEMLREGLAILARAAAGEANCVIVETGVKTRKGRLASVPRAANS